MKDNNHITILFNMANVTTGDQSVFHRGWGSRVGCGEGGRGESVIWEIVSTQQPSVSGHINHPLPFLH